MSLEILRMAQTADAEAVIEIRKLTMPDGQVATTLNDQRDGSVLIHDLTQLDSLIASLKWFRDNHSDEMEGSI